MAALVESMGFEAESFPSAEEFLEHFQEEAPCCVVTDLRMPGMSGLDLQKALVEKAPSVSVILISAYASTRATVSAMKAGAVTFLDKTCAEHELCEAILTGIQKSKDSFAQWQRKKRLTERFQSLTRAEFAVVSRVAQGKSNKHIAQDLDISIRTVEDRRRRAMNKLEVDSAAELVRMVFAFEQDEPRR